MKRFFARIRESFTGGDGKLSSRKLSAFLHYILMTISTGVLWQMATVDIVLLYCIITHGAFALLLLGIITIQHIVSIAKASKGINEH